MKTIRIELPNLYADHHVVEVRKILLGISGVVEVFASSAFGVVEVTYDPLLTNDLQIKIALDQAGYLNEWTFPRELGTASYNEPVQPGNVQPFIRHTEVYASTRQVVSFAQTVPGGRPLWPCPGMGVIKSMEE